MTIQILILAGVCVTTIGSIITGFLSYSSKVMVLEQDLKWEKRISAIDKYIAATESADEVRKAMQQGFEKRCATHTKNCEEDRDSLREAIMTTNNRVTRLEEKVNFISSRPARAAGNTASVLQ